MGINKEITKCIIEIITLIFIVIFTYPVLHMIRESEGAKIAEYYDNYEASDVTLYYEKKADLNNLYPVTNEYALNNLDYSIINVINNTKENKKYNLMLIVEKNSTLDINYLMININGKTLKLSDCYYTENNYITYYLIDSNTIKTNTINYNKIYIWLNSDTPNSEQNKNLNINFAILDKINTLNSWKRTDNVIK